MSVEDTLIGFSKKVVGAVWYGGAEVPLEFVRKDGQCSVWDGGSFVFFRTHPSDFSKEVLMRCSGPHIPKLERIGRDDKGFVWYKSPKYERLRASHREAWRQFKILDSAYSKAVTGDAQAAVSSWSLAWGVVNDEFVEMLKEEDLPDTLKKAVCDVILSASSFSRNFCLDFFPKNLGVGHNKDLVLWDVVYFFSDSST